ncbi:hypothetical protein [Roseisolibacter agri]|uniref:Uncharacterized protein n=1 Tax=Roseisolibacter agri TaxID=2014610 RepID=A0AA37VGF4_9BACT|nr:hypothetical protein [Roseisolibacter agri]GLC28439.1 hypothetical protein rosag_49520 [Roseisolibacter agri]
MSDKPTKEEREAAAERAVARSVSAFVIRRPLDGPTTLAAVGAGLIAGLVTAYLSSIWLSRAPLAPTQPRPTPRPLPRTRPVPRPRAAE